MGNSSHKTKLNQNSISDYFNLYLYDSYWNLFHKRNKISVIYLKKKKKQVT